MSMVMDVATSIVSKVVTMGFSSIKRGFGYVMSSERYAKNLAQEIENLASEDWTVRSAEEKARKNLQKIEEAKDLLGKFEEARKTRCGRTLPDPNSRYQFSRKAKHMTDDIRKLIKEMKEISSSGPALGDRVAPILVRREGKEVVSASMSIKLRGHGLFKSRALMRQNIMDALADNSNGVVGVYGMGGVGKSTLLDQVEDILIEERSFDWVAKADVSENPDIRKIQGDIAACLKLTDIMKEETISARAELLRERLEKEGKEKKKVLIILDNLWENLDLKSVGIPCGPDNKAIGCKLLLTSRDLNVLQREMGCDKAFRLGGLKEDEARALFETMVGGKVQVELEPLVEEALRISAGLPFLIVAISKLFLDTTYSDCEYALKQIWNEDTGEVIKKTLRMSYERIKSEAKSLLQLIAVYGVSKPSLENLLRYGFGLGLFGDESSMEDARIMLSSLIEALQDSSLLLHSEESDGFKMHVLVREFVASIISKDRPLLVLNESVAELSKDKLQSCVGICFPYVDMKKLPEELDCPELRTFLLFANNESLEVPDSYFNFMRKLKVLNLTGIRLSRSPSPFQYLEKLHTLCLDGGSLDNVAILGDLEGLQILSLQNSDIQRLPKEIGQLVELRLLDLSRCSQLEIIEPDVLGRLTKLEELYMEDSFDQWSAVEQTPATNASLMELNNMKRLHTLHVTIPNLSMLPEDLCLQQLTKYRIRLGYALRWSKYKGSMTLELSLNPISDVLRKRCIQSIIGRTDDLYLNGLNETEPNICSLSQEGFPKLKHLQVENSPSIRYILNGSSLPDFKALETLLLSNLVNLEKICYDHISTNSFGTLKVVRVTSCDKMEILFPHSLVRELPQLEEIEVFCCELMQGIVEADDGCKLEFPKLRVLKLHDLPNIKSFFTAGLAPSSSTSHDHVANQIAFFSGQLVAFPRLETIEVDNLGNLGFMFSPSMVTSLPQLRKLRVSDCKKMEAIIMEEEVLGVEISESLSFPMLADLCLEKLESLTCFSRVNCSRGRGQDRVQSRSSALFNGEVAFPNLERCSITRTDNIEMIWDNQFIAESFFKLKSLFVSGCNKLVTVVPPFILGQLRSLEILEVEACGSLELVFGLHPLIPLDGHPVALSLKELTVSGLPKLKCVWDKELCRQVKFQHLRSISVSKCNNLTSLFPASVTRDLIQLEELVICECGIVELIEKEEGLVPMFVFPKLISLQLEHLIELKCLYTGTHTSYWPALKTLQIDDCNKVDILASQTENEIPHHKQPLFLIEKGAFPKLQELKLDLSKHMEICHGKFHDEESFRKLRVLELRHLSKEYAISTCRFVESLTKLEELVLCESYLEDPTKNVQAIEDPLHELKVILPVPTRIQHLKTLDVSNFHGLSSMFTPTIAENLVALTKLRISNCRILTTVISDDEFEEKRVVAFSQLKYIELEELIELRCFSSSGYTLEFPLLEDVIVNKCPNMKFFSEGLIEAPKLKRVKVDSKEQYGTTKHQYFWKGDLNTTIQNLYEEMAMVAGAKLQSLTEIDDGTPSLFTPQEHSGHMFQTMALSPETYSNSELQGSQESKIMELLELEVNDVRIVGIHGRDGIGKTALAKIVYDQISHRFDACSFLAEIEETTQQPGGLQYLHTKLIFDILKREYEAASAFEEVGLLKEIFKSMKVLIILDDVKSGSLKQFVGDELEWFGCGSRIIVTSKERSVLQGLVDRDSSHDVIPMHPNRAFHFFWRCAIEKSEELNSHDLPSHVSIANNIVEAAKGLPLLLEVFGSFLRDKGLEEWIDFEDLIEQSQEDPQKILSRIYDALAEQQKQMYLDIACFPPDVDCRIASYMWHDYDHPDEVMEVLRRMSLIKTEENKIGMHSMLRCLAREIIRKEGFHDPGAGVGLYDPAIAQEKNKGKRKADHLITEVAAHEMLPNTTFLSLGRANDGGKFADALSKVRWLHWQGCPPDASSIHLEENENLTILELPWSKVTESWDCWNGRTMERLKVLNFTGCADLIVTPSFSCCPNLEMLILERCSRLVHLDPSINDLKFLVTLNLKFCSELTMLPVEMGGMNALRELLIDDTSVRELPMSIGKLAQLQILSATNCFSLVHVPDSVWKLEALVVLVFDGAKILELPEAIGDLKKLRRLSLRDCRGLEELPYSIDKLADSLEELDISGTGISRLPDSTKRLRNLKSLKMDSCFIRELPRDIEWLTNLEEVHASLCRSLGGDIPSGIWLLRHLRELRLRATRISSLPPEIQFMSSLETLDLSRCNLLKELPTLPPPDLRNLDVNPELKKKMLESSEFSRWSHLLR